MARRYEELLREPLKPLSPEEQASGADYAERSAGAWRGPGYELESGIGRVRRPPHGSGERELERLRRESAERDRGLQSRSDRSGYASLWREGYDELRHYNQERLTPGELWQGDDPNYRLRPRLPGEHAPHAEHIEERYGPQATNEQLSWLYTYEEPPLRRDLPRYSQPDEPRRMRPVTVRRTDAVWLGEEPARWRKLEPSYPSGAGLPKQPQPPKNYQPSEPGG